MPAWPASLPQAPLARGYQEAFGDTTLRTQMDAGPDKLRRRFTAGVDSFTTLLRLTKTQAATFESFYKTDTAGGTLAFTWVHPRTRRSCRCGPRSAGSRSRHG